MPPKVRITKEMLAARRGEQDAEAVRKAGVRFAVLRIAAESERPRRKNKGPLVNTRGV